MSKLSTAKWLAASGGLFGLATLLALSHTAPVNTARSSAALGRASITNVLDAKAAFPATPASSQKANSSQKADVVKKYGQLPLSFEPALLPSSAPAKFVARGSGYALFLTNRKAVLKLHGTAKTQAVLQMELTGANAAPHFAGEEVLPGKSNYFIGNDPKKWITNVPQYGRVVEKDVYPGVNLVYYGTQGRLEYDFDVAPGADPSAIRLAFNGAKNLRLDDQGELVLTTGAGDVRLRKPVAYQEIGGVMRPVEVSYALQGKNRASFEIAKYDSKSPLVIDPILIYSTYLGGSGIDTANGIAVAADNTAFVAGGTDSLDFPTVHALQANDGGNPDFPQDAFVSKISADGSTLLYSTYLGGENRDTANGIAVDSFGDAFVVGTTLSPHYPVVTGSFNTECGGDGQCGASLNNGLLVSNGFVTELNPAGSALIYSGFIGEDENVNGLAIAVDSNDNAYATGTTQNNAGFPFPIVNAFQTSFGGLLPTSTNAFVMKIGSTGKTILYSSFLGGNTEDVGNGIAVDANGNAFVTGLTYSSNFPVTTAATYQGAGDAFVSEVTDAGATSALSFSTLLGGTGLDQGNAIAVATGTPLDTIYIAGQTNSASIGLSSAGFDQPTNAGQGDAFVASLTINQTTFAESENYFTFLGGTHADAATGIAIDSAGHAYVTGTTASTDFPTSGAAFQPAYGGGNTDSFVAELNPAGTALVYSSYLGGTNAELATGIAVDTNNSAYVTGQTCSTDFPLANPLQEVPGGNCDAYISKIAILNGFVFNPSGLIFGAQSLNTTSQPQTVTLTNGDTAYQISSVALTGANAGDFNETTTCPTGTIAVGGTCTVTVTFTPTANGIRQASLTITDTAPGSPHVINITGNTSTVTLSASSLAFGQQIVGTTSNPQTVTVTNSGTTALTFSSIIASGDFAEGDTCVRAPLQPGSTCNILVEFSPTAAVSEVGSITLNDTGSGSPQTILTTGTGILAPTAILSSSNLTFTNTSLGASSTAQLVALSNVGNAPLLISGIATAGDFSETNSCGTTLASGASCNISVVFTPTTGGTRSGTLTVTDNSGNIAGSTQTATLTGTAASFSVTTSTPTPSVPAGKSATITLTVNAIGGFNQSVSLACSAPATITCSVAPSVVVPTASGTPSAILTVNTALRTMAPPIHRIHFDPTDFVRGFHRMWLVWIALLLMILTAAALRRRPITATFGFAVVLLLASVACSGGGSPGQAAGTPAGTYQVTVTATSGTRVVPTQFTVQVD